MVDVLLLLWTALTSLFRSRERLEAEILVLRQQINVLRRKSPKRSVFRTFDRLVFVGLYRLVPGILDALAIVRPQTVVRWHRTGLRSFWYWKFRWRVGGLLCPAGGPSADSGASCLANPLWGALPAFCHGLRGWSRKTFSRAAYRLLKAHYLIASPAYIVIKSHEEFKDKTTEPNQLWPHRLRLHLRATSAVNRLRCPLSSMTSSRYIIAWKPATTMQSDDVGRDARTGPQCVSL